MIPPIKTILTLLTFALFFVGCEDIGPLNNKSSNMPQESIDLSNYTQEALTDEQKYSLAYMWHEEKLAYELYLALDALYPSQQLANIPTKSEIKHIALVEQLVAWYDLNISNVGGDYMIKYEAQELDAMPAGIFAIQEIQDLYDSLYAKGKSSQQSSLEVGCMVEVVDVNDLDADILLAEDNAALVDTFNILRNGSYNHYWAFDKGLKNLGVTDGCCSLSTEYCHPEYPQNSKGK